MEPLKTGEIFLHYRALSNQLSTPKVLVCPADTRKAAPSFSVLSNSNVSYFVSLDAEETLPQSMLAGDRNLTTNGVPVPSGLVELRPGAVVGWTRSLHRGVGYVALCDGSLQGVTKFNLPGNLGAVVGVTNRLVIP